MSGMYDCEKNYFFNAEHFMLFHKALVFNDIHTAKKILHSINPSMIKEYGSHISNYDHNKWCELREDIITLGNYYKFTQNNRLIDVIQNIITDLSLTTYNVIWWSGYKEIDRLHDKKFWNRINVLGKCLMRVKKIIETKDTELITRLENKIYKDINGVSRL